MIIGIGIDTIEIKRMAKAFEKQGFANRCFTEKELFLIGSSMSKAAGNFAVKEAVSKVFGTGFRTMELHDIEVLRDEAGKPYVNLYGEAVRLAEESKINKIHISITNTSSIATAFAVGEEV